MCDVCGCGHGEVRIGGASGEQGRHHHHGHDGGDQHDHHHHHGHGGRVHHGQHHAADGSLHFGEGSAHATAPGLSQARLVQIEQDVLAKNDAYARENRRRLGELRALALNLVSSPGSGKTTLLTATIERMHDAFPIAVVEGDQQTFNDVERIRATGVPALQINTGKGCHLDAHMVGHALDGLPLEEGGILFIENVGNLVCPAGFDLGEAHKVVILSVTEGEDKPLKYPDMFAAADLVLLNKVDLLPYLDFHVPQCIEYARRVNPNVPVLALSARSGEGLEAWVDWIATARSRVLRERLRVLESWAEAQRAQLANAPASRRAAGG